MVLFYSSPNRCSYQPYTRTLLNPPLRQERVVPPASSSRRPSCSAPPAFTFSELHLCCKAQLKACLLLHWLALPSDLPSFNSNTSCSLYSLGSLHFMSTESSWHLRKVRFKKAQQKWRKRKLEKAISLFFLSPHCIPQKLLTDVKQASPRLRRAPFATLLPFLKPQLEGTSSAHEDREVQMPACSVGKACLSTPVRGRMWSRWLSNMHPIFAVAELWYQTDMGWNQSPPLVNSVHLKSDITCLNFLIYKIELIVEHSS